MLGFGALGQFALGQANSNAAFALAAGAGSFTLSGQDVDLLFHRRLYASSDVSADIGHVLFAALGGVALGQGQIAITDAATTFVLRGENVGLRFSYRVATGAGSYVLTGFDVALRATRTMAAAVGTFTLTGVDVALLAARKLIVGVGSFVLSGNSVETIYHKPRISVFSRAASAIFGRSGAASSVSGRAISGQGIKGRSTGGLE